MLYVPFSVHRVCNSLGRNPSRIMVTKAAIAGDHIGPALLMRSREILPQAAAALTLRVPSLAFLDGGNERGQPARGDRFAIDTLHDALSAQRDGDGFPTVLLPAQIADQRKNRFNDGSRARTARCVTVCRQSRLGLGAILRQAFCIDRHFRDIGIPFQQCQQDQFRAGTLDVE